jgi:hypothetical protein
MTNAPDFNLATAHRYFAASCFNRAWDLIENDRRTAEDDREMVASSLASLYHWTQRTDCTDRNLSIAYWQASHVHVLIGSPAEGLRLAQICLSYSGSLAPFFLGHAHEAVARAQIALGQVEGANEHLATARDLLPSIKDMADRRRLDVELSGLEEAAGR